MSYQTPQGYPPPPGPPPGPPMPYGYGPPPNSGHPVQLTIERPETQSRVLALFSIPYFLVRFIALIPALIVLYVVGIVAAFAAWFGMWAVLFTGHNPEGLHTFVVGYLRWSARASAFALGLTDKYPPFTFAP